MTTDYLRGVLSNNIERVQDIIWDIENVPRSFMKEDSCVQGVLAVARQIETSLVALRSDLDEAPAQPDSGSAFVTREKDGTVTIEVRSPHVQDSSKINMPLANFETLVSPSPNHDERQATSSVTSNLPPHQRE